MARLRGCKREQITPERGLLSSPVRPEGSPGRPVRPKTFVMSNRILDDESLHTLRMRQCHPKTDRPTVVLHVKRVVRQTERLREVIHHGGDIVEGVIKLFGVGPVAVSVTRVIGSNQTVVICNPCE